MTELPTVLNCNTLETFAVLYVSGNQDKPEGQSSDVRKKELGDFWAMYAMNVIEVPPK